jgi:hypothetical protein
MTAAPGSSKKRTADAADVADEEMVSKERGRRGVGGGGLTFPFFLLHRFRHWS